VTGGPRPSWAALAPEGTDGPAAVAARLGAYCWVEQQLFGLLGTWVVEIAEPDVKVLVAEHAEHAAWRALRWFELLPSAPPGADAIVAAPAGTLATWARVESLAAGPEATATKVCLAHQVLMPALLVAYTAHGDWASPVTEAAATRVLAMASHDLASDVADGQRLLAALQVAPSTYAAARAEVEEALAGVGGLVGAGSAGARPV